MASGAVAGVLALTLSACGADATETTPAATGGSDNTETAAASGAIAGAGASSQEKAMGGWIATATSALPDLTVTYEAVGSGGGREQFLGGGVQFAGTDAALKPEEKEAAVERCYGGEAVQLPLYISPIAVVYNLPSVDAANLNMSAETIAKIFNGDITKWNDDAIAAENEGVDLPDLDIIPVNRSDESGTTENFTEYLVDVAGDAWPHEASGDWPRSGTQSGNGTSGVIDTVTQTEGAITYADASRAGSLGTAALKVGEEYVPFSAEAAAAVVDASPRAEDASATNIVVELDRATTASGAYPMVLISYSVACSVYETEADANNVKAFLTYVASEAGQAVAAEADVAGSAPISAALRSEVQAAIDSISVAG
ncbi:phosphate ABC transporter substrate-binding protein PstS [Jonesia quinghaiensis]|uniref:phosphate ABC transporter substrate-binding protein PstS n=1 Tax=Jonesia quinghaiensis TaxID=262806 RepID=UPI00056CED04|nr:phosphate ABC transporter substrate-binding protein PstS [Jonesia quinghaiensis]